MMLNSLKTEKKEVSISYKYVETIFNTENYKEDNYNSVNSANIIIGLCFNKFIYKKHKK